jgi:hypothetical protein
MTIAQLLKKHRNQINAFDRAYAKRRVAILNAQKKHLNARKKAANPNNSGTKKSAKASKLIYNFLLRPLIKKNAKL